MKNNQPPPDPFVEQRTKVLKALKDYQRSGSFKANYTEVIDVLMEESDRGALMLVGGILEDVLANRIIEKLPNGDSCRDELFKLGGTLSTAQDKLTIGKALGILDEATVDSLDIIRRIRNACAHAMRAVDFTTPQVVAAFGLLLPEDLAEHVAEPNRDETFMRFVLAMVMVFHVEIIGGKTQDEAQAVVDRLNDNFQSEVFALAEKHKASRETQSKQSDQGDHPDQKEPSP